MPLALAGGAIAALGAMLLSSAAGTKNQENTRDAVNALVASAGEAGYSGSQQLSISAELWALMLGTTFPVTLLDPKYGVLTNPAVDNDTLHPVSVGGFVTQPSLPTDTGGSPVVETGDGTYTTPIVENPSLGNVYSLPWGQSASEFEKSLATLPSGERVAIVKTRARELADSLGWPKDSFLTKLNGRDVYAGSDGYFYAVDSQHGRWEQVNSRGKHQGEVKFDLTPIPKSKDDSGKHDLRMK
ncbi:hypothetical protein [Pseudomonas sp. NPDC087615]|uniref:hypothetical protein n=1 Tax=Pseudomonas sp. NPDC087615 TaxID=3364443 RepID=UPI0038161537